MEDRRISEKESLEIITEMISRTKERYRIGDGNIMLMWGYLTVIVTAAVWIMLALTKNGIWNWLWFAIPTVGYILTLFISKNNQKDFGVKSYSDVISSKIWTIVGITGILATAMCLGFMFIAHADSWMMWFAYGLIIVPMAEICQGLVIREKAFIGGGFAGLVIGMFTLCCICARIPLKAMWFMPLFMLAFVAMLIVPGHILNHKARKQ